MPGFYIIEVIDMVQKIVVNHCYGGFGLSPLAQKRYLELIGKECYFYKQTKYAHENDGVAIYNRISVEDAEDTFDSFVRTIDCGEVVNEFPKNDGYWYDHDIERDDPMLIRVIEELGQRANEKYSNLEIVEIPDGVKWQIEEYDGNEHIAEEHRTW
jgi:hypothetical protein